MKTHTITQHGFSAHYGSPDEHIVITFSDESCSLYRGSYGGDVYYAICHSGITPPGFIPRGDQLMPIRWHKLEGEKSDISERAGIAAIIEPQTMGSRHLSPEDVARGVFCWQNALRNEKQAREWDEQAGTTAGAYSHLGQRRASLPYRIDFDSDPVTGPLAGLDPAQQNAVANLLLG